MDIRRYCKLAIGCIGLMSVAGTASAMDNFDEASQQLCEHLRECTLKTMDAESNANMRKMVDGMVQGMCKKMTRQFKVEGYEDIRNSAAACMRSMTEQDCDALDSSTSTPACREYEKMAETYSEGGE